MMRQSVVHHSTTINEIAAGCVLFSSTVFAESD